MILYSLACDEGHRFDSWFASSAAFDQLSAQGALSCPTCASSQVAKAIMAPALVATPGRELAPQPPTMEVALLDDKRKELRSMIKALRDRIVAETQDVGDRFPQEARRMHEGDIPHREIRGQATIDQARSLLEDGITIFPLPELPEDLN